MTKSESIQDVRHDEYLRDMEIYKALAEKIPVIQEASEPARALYVQACKDHHKFFDYFFTTPVKDYTFKGYLRSREKGTVFVEDLKPGNVVQYEDEQEIEKRVTVLTIDHATKTVYFEDDERIWYKDFNEIPECVKLILQ